MNYIYYCSYLLFIYIYLLIFFKNLVTKTNFCESRRSIKLFHTFKDMKNRNLCLFMKIRALNICKEPQCFYWKITCILTKLIYGGWKFTNQTLLSWRAHKVGFISTYFITLRVNFIDHRVCLKFNDFKNVDP